MAKRFTIDFLINLITKGKNEFSDLEKQAKNLSKTTDKSQKEVTKSFDKISDGAGKVAGRIGTIVTKLEDLESIVSKINSKSSLEIIDEAKIRKDAQEINTLLIAVSKLRKEADKSGNVDLVNKLDTWIAALKQVKSEFIAAADAAKSFNNVDLPKLKFETINKGLNDLNKRFEDSKKTVKDFNNTFKSLQADIAAGKDVDLINTTNLRNAVVGLENQKITVESLIATYKKLYGEDSSPLLDSLKKQATQIKTNITRANNLLSVVEKTNKTEIAPRLVGKLSAELDSVKRKFNTTISALDSFGKSYDDIVTRLRRGNLVDLIDTRQLTNGINLLEQNRRAVQLLINENRKLGANADPKLSKELENIATQLDIDLQNFRELRKEIDLVNSKEIIPKLEARFKTGIKELRKDVAGLIKDLNKSEKSGEAFANNPRLSAGLQQITDNFLELRKIASDLGIDDAELIQLDRILARLATRINRTDEELQRLDKTARDSKLNDLLNTQNQINKIKKLEQELAKLIKQIIEAKEKGQNIEIVTTFKRRAAELGAEINQFQEENVNPALLPNIARAKSKVTDVSGIIADVEKNVPKSAIGRTFKEIGERARAAFKEMGSQQAVVRSVATGLRLIGTAGFVAGGYLRTFGFAFSALGSIMQNFVPIAIGVLKALGPLAPLAVVIGASLIALATQAATFITALGLLIGKGIEVNNVVDTSKNNIAGLVSEFYNIYKNGVLVTDTLDQFTKAGALASGAINRLQVDALATNFTFEELVPTFQTTVTALGGLGSSLDKAEQLTVGFARIAILARYDANQLSTSIAEILSGRGRVTNNIQRILNTLKDSKGIALTAERIRQLRAEKGDVLIDELTAAFRRLTAQAADANTRTLPGIISNFKDLYGFISQRVAVTGLDTLKTQLLRIYDLFVSIRKDSEGVAIDIQINPRVQKLIELFQILSNLILEDLGNGLEKLARYIIGLGDNLRPAIAGFVRMYLASVDLVKSVGSLVVNFLDLLGINTQVNSKLQRTALIVEKISNGIQSTANDLKGINILLLYIEGTIKVLSFFIIATLDKIFKGIGYFVGKAFPSLGESISNIFQTELDRLGNESAAIVLEIDKLKAELNEIEKQQESKPQDRAKEVDSIVNDQLKKIEEQRNKLKNELAGISISGKGESKGLLGEGKSVLQVYLNFFDELIRLVKSRNQILLDEENKRIDGELELFSKLEEKGLLSTSRFNENLLKLESERIAAQLNNLKAEKRNLEERTKQVQIAFAVDTERTKEEFKKKPTEEGKDNTAELESELDKLKLRRNKEFAEIERENEELTSKIRTTSIGLASLEVDFAQRELQRISNIRQELLQIREDIFSRISDSDVKGLDETFLDNVVEGISESFRKNAIQIKDYEFEVQSLKQSIQSASGVELNLLSERAGRLETLKNQLSEINELTIRKIALDIQDRNIQRIDRNIQVIQNQLRREEDSINLRVSRGLLSQRDAVTENTIARTKFNDALKTQIERLKQISESTPDNLDLKEKLAELEQQVKSFDNTVTESVLLNINQEVGTGLIDFLEKVQENIGNTTNALKDLGNVFLRAFRRTVAQQIVEQFFAPIIGQLGQTEGKAQGFLANFLRNIGIEPAVQQQKKVDAQAQQTLSAGVKNLIDTTVIPLETIIKSVEASLQKTLTRQDSELQSFVNVIGITSRALSGLGKVSGDIQEAFKSLERFILQRTGEKINLGTSGIPEAERGKINIPTASGVLNSTNITTSGNARIDKAIYAAAAKRGIDPGLLFSVAKQESNFNPNAISKAKTPAKGLFQFIDTTANRFGIDPYNIEQAADGAARYLVFLLEKFKGRVDLALAGYNAGEGAVQRFGNRIPPFKETQGYVKSILGTYSGTGFTPTPVPQVENKFNSLNDFIQRLNLLKTSFAGSVDAFDEGIKNLSLPIFDSSLLTSVEAVKLQIESIKNLSSTINSVIETISAAASNISSGISNLSTSDGGGKSTVDKVSSIFDTVKGFFDLFSGNKKADGGYISGKGGRIQDIVPAMLSNGEYVINSATVEKYGKAFFDRLNRGFAEGGFVRPDSSKYSFLGGGAKLKELPKAIEYVAPPEKKKPGLFRRIFGRILSFAAPFLNLIPGIGPLLAIGAGAAGGALSGTDKKSSILGGILGGLGNFGGFAGKGGNLGKFADILNKGKVKDILGVFGGALGNSSSTLQFFGNNIFEQFFKPKKKGMGGMIRKPKKYLFGGFVNSLGGLLGIGTSLFGLFGGNKKGGGSGSGFFDFENIFPFLNFGGQGFGGLGLLSLLLGDTLGEGAKSPKGLAKILPILGLSRNAFGSLFAKSNKKATGGIISSIGGIFSKLFGRGGLKPGQLPVKPGGFLDYGKLTNQVSGLKTPGILSKLFGGSGSGGLGSLFSLFGGLGGGSEQKKPNDFDEVNPSGFEGSADPDYLRKNFFGSAYNFLGDEGFIPKFNYTQEILDFIDSVYNPVQQKAQAAKSSIFGNIAGVVSTLLGLLALNKSKNSSFKFLTNDPSKQKFVTDALAGFFGKGSGSGSGGIFSKIAGVFKGFFGKAAGGYVTGRGSGTSDSIPAMLSNGEYVLKAAAVKRLGLDMLEYLNNARNIDRNTLDYINSGRVKLAAGGLVGEGIDSIGQGKGSGEINVDNRMKIINVLDPNLFKEYLNTSDGRREFVNFISSNKSMFKNALGIS